MTEWRTQAFENDRLLGPRAICAALLLSAVALTASMLLLPAPPLSLAAAAGGAVLAATLAVAWRRAAAARAVALRDAATLAALDVDAAPAILTDGAGAVLGCNGAASNPRARDLRAALEPFCLAPGEIAARLRRAIRPGGPGAAACEPIVTPDGAARLQLLALHADRLLWRVAPDAAPLGAAETAPDASHGTNAVGDASLFEMLPVALVKLAADGRVLQANERARALLPGLALPDHSFASVVTGLGRSVGQWVREAAAGRGLGRRETLLVTGSVPERYVQVSFARPAAAADASDTLVAVLHDATEMKVLEAQFVQSQKMQAVGQLAGGVAHDFNNLLTAILGHCDLMLLRVREEDADMEDLYQIRQNAARAAALVSQLLAFSRKQKLTMRDVDLREALGNMVNLIDRLVGENVRLSLVHDPALLPIRADIAQLEQVVLNLVVNARDAMPRGGAVRIETATRFLAAPMTRDRVTVPSGQYVCVIVSDDGDGIPPDVLPRIFEPFFTTKRIGEGTGLGLAMAYGVMKQSGGYIFADSEPGRGATFTLLFPVGDASGAAGAPAETAAILLGAPPSVGAQTALPARARRPVVLLVEDEAPVRAFAARVLALKGFDVRQAADGEEALEMLDDAALRVDAFVSDVMMPGLDGPSWVRRALDARPGTPTVFMSGYSEDALPEGHAPVPGSRFLAKPFTLEALASAVERAVADEERGAA